MRRPLCALALLFVTAVFLILHFVPPDFPSFEALDGQQVTVRGIVSAKEFHTAADGTVTLLVTLRDASIISPAGAEKNAARGISGSDESSKEYPLPDDTVIYEGVLLSLAADPEDLYRDDNRIPIGAMAEAAGTLREFQQATNPGEFDSRLFYQIQRINFRLNRGTVLRISGSMHPVRNALYRLKRDLAAVLDRCLTAEDSAVLKAMLLGEKGFLSAELKELYQESGIIHILAISGLHVSLLGMGLFHLLRRLEVPMLPSCILPAVFLLLYAGMTDLRGSGMRAVCMFLIHLGAKLFRRTYDLLTAASVAAILLVCSQPLYLFHSGFLFSFCAILGIGILIPTSLTGFGRALAVPLAALPIYLRFYGTFPLYSLVLNLAVIPLMNVIMISGAAVLALGGLFLPAGEAAGVPCHILLYFYRAACELTAELPGHRLILGQPEGWQIFAYLVLLAAACAVGMRNIDERADESSRPYERREILRRKAVLFAVKGLLTAIAVFFLLYRDRSGLAIHFIDVGQGDGIYIEADGARILIDGGSSSKSMLGQYQLQPFLYAEGADHLDLAVLTHDDSDHCSGLVWLLENDYDIRCVALADMGGIPLEKRGENYNKILAICGARNIPVISLKRGDVISMPEKYGHTERMNILCVHPSPEHPYLEDVNQDSITLLVTYGNFRALLTGDLEEEGEQECLRYLMGQQISAENITVLKAGHHGSRYATSAEWLEFLKPGCTVISCGKNNRYGHPAEETMQRLRDAETIVYDTRYSGEIEFRTDGKTVRIREFLNR